MEGINEPNPSPPSSMEGKEKEIAKDYVGRKEKKKVEGSLLLEWLSKSSADTFIDHIVGAVRCVCVCVCTLCV